MSPSAAPRTTPRPRRQVSHRALWLLKPLFGYSHSRRAYVLRLVGGNLGPVLIERRAPLRLMPEPELTGEPVALSRAEAQLASDPYASASRSAIASSE